MTELTEEEELERTNKLIKQFTDFLIEAEKDFELESWDSGDGRDVVVLAFDEDTEQEYKIKFAFKNNSYLNIDIEKIEKEVQNEKENEKN